jgi:hypothetical protein
MPYGGIGFASHIMTYLTVLCLALGASPIFPWQNLKYKRFNILVATVGLIATVTLSTLSIVRCRQSWPLLLIALWKLILSLTLSFMTIHAATTIEERGRETTDETKEKKFTRILWWLFLYAIGMIIGLTGLGKLVKDQFDDNQKLRIITYAFVGVSAIFPFFVIIGLIIEVVEACSSTSTPSDQQPNSPVRKASENIFDNLMAAVFGIPGVVILCFGALFAFYSDWALAAMTGDMSGSPSSDNAIFFWCYFAAKRLPIFSF